MLRFLTAGESHGKALVAILEGCPANLPLLPADIDKELLRRQQGYGRGGRMKIERDRAEILSGVRQGRTIGSPIALLIPNKSTALFGKTVAAIRPGHADLPGALKYGQKDIRNVLERASARETAAKVAVGAVAKKLLSVFNVEVTSRINEIGGASSKREWEVLLDQARKEGDTLGGVFEVVATGLPVGLGSYVHWDRRLSANLARAVMGIPAIKGVEFGLGFDAARTPGSMVQDELFYLRGKGFRRETNNAGGLEGGMTNGEPLVIRAAVKPIATLGRPLRSVNLVTRKPAKALVERSDICAVEPAAVVGEAVVALELAGALLAKFGGDAVEDVAAALRAYRARL